MSFIVGFLEIVVGICIALCLFVVPYLIYVLYKFLKKVLGKDDR